MPAWCSACLFNGSVAIASIRPFQREVDRRVQELVRGTARPAIDDTGRIPARSPKGPRTARQGILRLEGSACSGRSITWISNATRAAHEHRRPPHHARVADHDRTGQGVERRIEPARAITSGPIPATSPIVRPTRGSSVGAFIVRAACPSQVSYRFSSPGHCRPARETVKAGDLTVSHRRYITVS